MAEEKYQGGLKFKLLTVAFIGGIVALTLLFYGLFLAPESLIKFRDEAQKTQGFARIEEVKDSIGTEVANEAVNFVESKEEAEDVPIPLSEVTEAELEAIDPRTLPAGFVFYDANPANFSEGDVDEVSIVFDLNYETVDAAVEFFIYDLQKAPKMGELNLINKVKYQDYLVSEGKVKIEEEEQGIWSGMASWSLDGIGPGVYHYLLKAEQASGVVNIEVGNVVIEEAPERRIRR